LRILACIVDLSSSEVMQCIELEAHAVKGMGRTHAKWSPVATAKYKMLPEVSFTLEKGT
jgi:DNA-directed RNA polymerase alpha subunit